MNTQYVRKMAICESLAGLFRGTCQYSPDTLCRWDTPIEPDEPALHNFRIMLAELAEYHFYNRLTVKHVESVLSFVDKTGFKYGHVTGSYTTGTWGVRHSELQNIIKILSIPDYELLPIGNNYKIYDMDCKIESYHQVHKNWLFVTIKPDNYPEQNPFDISFEWDSFINERILEKS